MYPTLLLFQSKSPYLKSSHPFRLPPAEIVSSSLRLRPCRYAVYKGERSLSCMPGFTTDPPHPPRQASKA